MTGKPVIPRELANRDVEQAIDFYLGAGSHDAALGFVDSLEQAYQHIAAHPGTGSPRYAHELGVAELRSWPLTRFPYLVFYMERTSHIDVWRVLHLRQDIPAWSADQAE